MFLFLTSAPIATGLLVVLAGVSAPFIIQAIKKARTLTGRWPIVVSATVSIILGFIVFGMAWFTGEATSWRDAIGLAPWIFSEANLLYHLGLPVDLKTSPLPIELDKTLEQKKETGHDLI